MAERRRAIEGQIIMLAGAQASVTLPRLSDLLDRAAQYLTDRRETYERRYERVDAPEEASYYLADAGHWEDIGTQLGFDDRETDAVRRAHEEQFERDGRRMDREEEFTTSLEIRDVVAIPTDVPFDTSQPDTPG